MSPRFTTQTAREMRARRLDYTTVPGAPITPELLMSRALRVLNRAIVGRVQVSNQQISAAKAVLSTFYGTVDLKKSGTSSLDAGLKLLGARDRDACESSSERDANGTTQHDTNESSDDTATLSSMPSLSADAVYTLVSQRFDGANGLQTSEPAMRVAGAINRLNQRLASEHAKSLALEAK